MPGIESKLEPNEVLTHETQSELSHVLESGSRPCSERQEDTVGQESIKKLTIEEMRDVESELGIKLSQGKGVPMFLRCDSVIKNKTISFDLEIDSGADRCIMSKMEALRLGVKFRPFKSPKAVSGLGAESLICKHFCIINVKIHSRDGEIMHINLLFYIFEGFMPNLLGSDCINYMNGRIDYAEKSISLDDKIFQLFLEERIFNDRKKRKRGTTFYFTTDTCIPPKTCRRFPIRIDGPVGEGKSAFIGDYDGELVVMDTAYDGEKKNYWAVVMNVKSEPVRVKREEKLGYIIKEEEDNSIYSIDELLADPVYFNQDLRDKGGEYHNDRDRASKTDGPTDKPNNHSEGVETLKIPDRRRMAASELNRFYDEGVPIPNPGKCMALGPMKGKEIIDQKIELEKNSKSDMWVDKELFYKNFLWDKMRKEVDAEVGEVEGVKFENKLKQLFWDYRGVFWNGDWSKWGRAKIPDLEIEVEEGTSAIDKYRKMTDEKEALLKAYMSDLLKAGVIEPSTGHSPYVANAHVIFEKRPSSTGYVWKYRYTIDYRNQNKFVKEMAYRLPLMDEYLRKASREGKWFMAFDLAAYFFQLPISERSRQITSFYLLDWGVFHWTTTPMGNKNSPVLAQRTTDYLSSFIQRCLGYIDDFILYSYILGDILINAEEFLATMSHFNLVLGPKKVNLVSKTQNFLGYSISYNSIIRVTEHKVTDLRDIKSPTSKDELKSILGLFAWYAQRSLLRDATKRMREMGKSDRRFKWDMDLESDLRSAISILLDPVTGCLRPPINPSESHPYVLFVDSSRSAFGGVLAQIQNVSEYEIENEKLDKNTKRMYLIGYYAKAIKDHQLLSPICILELESLFLCLKHWKANLLGKSTTIVYTDSKYVSFWISIEIMSEKIARYLAFISEFNLELRFLPSELNQADLLSRSMGKQKAQARAINPFQEMTIRNANGVVLKPSQLFSQDLRDELNKYFGENKRGVLAKVLGPDEIGDVGIALSPFPGGRANSVDPKGGLVVPADPREVKTLKDAPLSGRVPRGLFSSEISSRPGQIQLAGAATPRSGGHWVGPGSLVQAESLTPNSLKSGGGYWQGLGGPGPVTKVRPVNGAGSVACLRLVTSVRPVLSQLPGHSGGGLTGSGESQGTGGENSGAEAQPVSRSQVWGTAERAGSGSPADRGGTPPVNARDSRSVTGVRPNQSEALGDNPAGVVKVGTVPLADCGTVGIHWCGLNEVDSDWIARVTLFSAPTLTVVKMDRVDGAMTRGKGRRKSRAKRIARKAANKRLAGLSGKRPQCEECECKGLGQEIINHCTCICSTLKDIQVGGRDSEEGVWILSTDELQRGEVEMQVDDIFKDVELPSLSQFDLKRVRKGQLGPLAEKIKKWLKEGIPSHRESLSLDSKEISILGQISLFRLNNQEIIYRLFVKPNGETYLLWFCEGPLLPYCS